MNIMISAHHVEITDAIKDHVHKKISKIHRFFDNIQQVEVDLEILDVAKEEERQQVTATVWAAGTVIRAKEHQKDMYAAIDLLVEKLERQLKKHKEKTNAKNRKASRREFIQEMMQNHKKSETLREKDEKNHYIPKPMHIEDAANILEYKGIQFLVFRNASNEKINVIYITDDGELALIEP